jgi:lysophospholipase L1-like esterase
VKSAEEVTYRAYFPAEVYGEYEYCFYFSNAVDSTYSTGAPVYVGCETGEYTIISAKIADGGTSVDDEITNYTDVTFDGESGKTVQPGDAFWSDPVDFTLEEGHYIVWEWTITGTKIPATNMSDLTSTTSSVNGGDFEYCNEIPLPQLIGCDRNAKYTVAAIGDSITQGCMTDFMKYEYWSAQISQKLGGDYAFWNCGLGWARSSDAATDGDWLERTSNADIAIVAFGTNDINSGEYGGDGGNTAEEIDSYIRTIVGKLKDAGCAVVVFNAPPQDYEGENEATRTEYNEMLKATCAELGVYYFDFASYLCGEDDPAAAIYGGHPNGEAGGIVSDAFIEEFATLLQNG